MPCIACGSPAAADPPHREWSGGRPPEGPRDAAWRTHRVVVVGDEADTGPTLPAGSYYERIPGGGALLLADLRRLMGISEPTPRNPWALNFEDVSCAYTQVGGGTMHVAHVVPHLASRPRITAREAFPPAGDR